LDIHRKFIFLPQLLNKRCLMFFGSGSLYDYLAPTWKVCLLFDVYPNKQTDQNFDCRVERERELGLGALLWERGKPSSAHRTPFRELGNDPSA
jgi:hypothetical protein